MFVPGVCTAESVGLLKNGPMVDPTPVKIVLAKYTLLDTTL